MLVRSHLVYGCCGVLLFVAAGCRLVPLLWCFLCLWFRFGFWCVGVVVLFIVWCLTLICLVLFCCCVWLVFVGVHFRGAVVAWLLTVFGCFVVVVC